MCSECSGPVDGTQERHTEMLCRNCGLPISPLLDPWGGQHGYYHTTIERETNIDGADVMVYATFCPDNMGEAELFSEDSDNDGRAANR